MYKSNSFMFRSLDDAEEADFRKWPHEHAVEMQKHIDEGTVACLHPVVRDEWAKMQES